MTDEIGSYAKKLKAKQKAIADSVAWRKQAMAKKLEG
jgi:hypothetical protein